MITGPFQFGKGFLFPGAHMSDFNPDSALITAFRVKYYINLIIQDSYSLVSTANFDLKDPPRQTERSHKP